MQFYFIILFYFTQTWQIGVSVKEGVDSFFFFFRYPVTLPIILHVLSWQGEVLKERPCVDFGKMAEITCGIISGQEWFEYVD